MCIGSVEPTNVPCILTIGLRPERDTLTGTVLFDAVGLSGGSGFIVFDASQQEMGVP